MSKQHHERTWSAGLLTGPRAASSPLDAALDWPTDVVSRRRFLALLGASAALASGAACSRPDRGGIVPAARKAREAAPGVTSRYASTFAEGPDSYGVLVRTREGRPIHVEGNDLDPSAPGKAPLGAIADVLRLYDPDRLRGPQLEGRPASWDVALARLVDGLREARAASRPILLLSGASCSPTRQALLAELKSALPTLEHVTWEPASSDEERAALVAAFGSSARPRPHIDRARVVLSLGADPLGAGDPRAVMAFARRRPLDPHTPMSRLWVLEGGMTLTGAKADERRSLAPSATARLAFAIARYLHERGTALPPGVASVVIEPFDLGQIARDEGLPFEWLRALAEDLLTSPGAALVLAGPALPREAHVAAHLLNAMLRAEGRTIEAPEHEGEHVPSTLRDVGNALSRMAAGEFAGVLFWETNPAYAFPDEGLVRAAIEKTPLSAAITLHADETAARTAIVLAQSHWLESWGDHRPSAEALTLQQPALEPLFDTRAGEDVLLALVRGLGWPAPETYAEYLKERWRRDVHDARAGVSFERFWSAALHDGVVRRPAPPAPGRALNAAAVAEAAAAAARAARGDGFELLFTLGAVHDGRYGNNGWIQELPDPVTKLTWGNAVTVAPADARQLGIVDGMVVRLQSAGKGLALPALVQPGQAPGVLTLRLGYGRRAGSVATGIGVNAAPLLGEQGGPSVLRGVALAPTQASVVLPTTQMHQRMEGRDIVRSFTRAGLSAHLGGSHPEHALTTLYPETPRAAHRWGMAIDLSACVGCGACVVACQSENNVPVVGPEQVRRGREMHWIRIDRYYEGDDANPRVLHQPMLCQHCDHAPCETVCPVNATSHSPEGLNQMAYNRCVGTRYCANNCPYKVRRFNFLDFTGAKREPETLAMNPEVTVRPRGVMEKCTFCVQRIEEARGQSKAEGRGLRDGDVAPACGVACPSQAIVFGDLNDPESSVARLARDPRGYHVLQELGTRPGVTYLAGVRNPGLDPGEDGRGGGGGRA